MATNLERGYKPRSDSVPAVPLNSSCHLPNTTTEPLCFRNLGIENDQGIIHGNRVLMKDSFSNTVTATHPWLPCLICKQPRLATDKSILHAPQHCLVVFELTVSLCFSKRSSAYLEGVVMRTMQMSQEYSSAQLTKVHTPSTTSHSGPLFQSSSWPIWACTLTQAGAVDNLRFPFIFPQLHISQTP